MDHLHYLTYRRFLIDGCALFFVCGAGWHCCGFIVMIVPLRKFLKTNHLLAKLHPCTRRLHCACANGSRLAPMVQALFLDLNKNVIALKLAYLFV